MGIFQLYSSFVHQKILTRQYHFRYFGLWTLITSYLSQIFGFYPILMFCCLQIVCIIKFIYEIISIFEHQDLEGKQLHVIEIFELV